MEHTTNIITLRGELAGLPEFSHENHGRLFYRFELNVPRLSGNVDTLPVIAEGSLLEEMDLTRMDMLMLPGGLGGVSSVMGCEKALDAVRFAYENGKWVAAICAAPTVLAHLGITDGKHATCYPGCEGQMGTANMVEAAAVTDGKLITGTSAGCAIPFGLKLIEALKGEAEALRIAKQIVIR